MGTYQKGSFRRGSNIDLKLITCEDNIFIPAIIQGYVLHWHHKYILHPGMYIKEMMICQQLYCTGIRNNVQK